MRSSRHAEKIEVTAIRSSHELFRNYLSLKYRIFVEELGWQLPSNHRLGLADTDSYDSHSTLYIACCSDDGNPIGIFRATPIQPAIFPYSGLLKKYLSPEKLSISRDKICVLTSLAVQPPWRGRAVSFRGEQLTAAKCLLWTVIDDIRNSGLEACLLTAVQGVSVAFFQHAGAYRLAEQYILPNFSVQVRDLVILVNDCERFAELNSYLRLSCKPRALNNAELTSQWYLRRRDRT
ncbi:MAG: GNAT family N-acyltransferase [Pseudomonadota bacterium]